MRIVGIVVLTTKPAHMGPSLFYRQGSSEGQEKREKGGKPGIESRKLRVAFHRYGGPGILDADLWGADVECGRDNTPPPDEEEKHIYVPAPKAQYCDSRLKGEGHGALSAFPSSKYRGQHNTKKKY